MWEVVRGLQAAGVTIILTTHYIEEAEEMADRVGVINKGRLMLVEEKRTLMRQFGKKQLVLDLQEPVQAIPETLAKYPLELRDDGRTLVFTYDSRGERTGMAALLSDVMASGIRIRDLDTEQTSLEEIFVSLVRQQK